MAKIGVVGTTCQWKLVYQVYTCTKCCDRIVEDDITGKQWCQKTTSVYQGCVRGGRGTGHSHGGLSDQKNKMFTFLTNFSFYPPLWPKKVLEIKQHFLDPHLPVWQEKACGAKKTCLCGNENNRNPWSMMLHFWDPLSHSLYKDIKIWPSFRNKWSTSRMIHHNLTLLADAGLARL